MNCSPGLIPHAIVTEGVYPDCRGYPTRTIGTCDTYSDRVYAEWRERYDSGVARCVVRGLREDREGRQCVVRPTQRVPRFARKLARCA